MAIEVPCGKGVHEVVDGGQCDQIGRFIGLWATFQSLWQKLISSNLVHS